MGPHDVSRVPGSERHKALYETAEWLVPMFTKMWRGWVDFYKNDSSTFDMVVIDESFSFKSHIGQRDSCFISDGQGLKKLGADWKHITHGFVYGTALYLLGRGNSTVHAGFDT